MDQEFRFTDIARCKKHPKRLINCLYYKKECPYPSRFACYKCFLEYKTMEGFIDILDVLNNPGLLMTTTDQPKGKYNPLNQYSHLLEKDPEEFINVFKEDIFKQIEKLLNDLKEGVEQYKKFKAEITKVQEDLQSKETSQCEKFRQAFKDILKVENYHETEEWKQFEGTVQDFVLQFEDQQKKELNEASQKLQQMETVFFQQQLLSDFQSNISKSVGLLAQKLVEIEVFSDFTTLGDKHFQFELIKRIQNKKEVQPKVTLLFKGTQHGMNGQAFWEKCSNKGPTIVICKSKSGYVFGGYTPLKWVPSGDAWHKDESKTSFVFSYTRKEIYPITTGDNAICCDGSYGPLFGSGHQIYISLNFQDGSSNMDGKCYSNESYKIENPETHLMGGVRPELVEMEVFLVE